MALPSEYKELSSYKDMTENWEFWKRHIGPSEDECNKMFETLGVSSLAELIGKTVPEGIRLKEPLTLPDFKEAQSEATALCQLKEIAEKNSIFKSYIGQGYYNSYMPAVIARNVFENPGWYTQYTPYQPEISQGRLEALLNYQTLIADLSGLPVSNASLLDEATAAAEAMTLSYGIAARKKRSGANTYFVSDECHPQTIDVIRTRAEAADIEVVVGNWREFAPEDKYFGILLQYPTTYGTVYNYKELITECQEQKIVSTVAADVLALTLLESPAEIGADIAVGSTQRLGIPLGYGGPHAAYFATKDEYKRSIPGRLVGVSVDSSGKPALRLALQTREQHIRREKATSNICTAQVLLAVLAGMYAVYHGRDGLKEIAHRVHKLASSLAEGFKAAGFKLRSECFFDTVTIELPREKQEEILFRANAAKINLCYLADGISVSVDETTTEADIEELLSVITGKDSAITESSSSELEKFYRTDEILNYPVFSRYASESEMLRYIKRLESKDLSLCHSMIPLGSCTMKLNATSEMIPVGWPEFSALHPFAPLKQAEGYAQLFTQLESALAEMTGFAAVSLQPNAGSQGEYAGLLAIREYHLSRGDAERNVCLIPISAHGTNPASAIMAGMKVVAIGCDKDGNVDIADLKAKVAEHGDKISALMVTYPSTHGVFEEEIQTICEIVHNAGGQVYLDGANLNALIGLAKPGEFGADVCHMNLHKTFCIPHGGGGPGVGPIGVATHLAPFLPTHVFTRELEDGLGAVSAAQRRLGAVSAAQRRLGAVSAAPWGSASILPISWMYIAMMGPAGLTNASKVAILSANYIAKRLEGAYEVLYRGKNGFIAHECIIDLRPFKQSAGIEVADIAKRLIDYGFHAPTVSWPVPGTMMIEPTESESLAELDRFCDAMLAIRAEVKEIEDGKLAQDNNPLKNAPHTASTVSSDSWDYPYSREVAAYPSESTREFKFWPSVGRLNESYGDKNLVCSCPSVEDLAN